MMYEDYYEDYDAYAAAYEAEMAAQAEAEAQAAAEAEMQAEAEAAEAEWAENFRKEYGLYPDEVKALAKAREEGRLVILPCAPDSTVYKCKSNEVISGKVISVVVYSPSYIEFEIDWDGEPLEYVNADLIGKTIFTTFEEAQMALRRNR